MNLIEALATSSSVRITRDQRTAHAALRLLGAIEAGTGVQRFVSSEQALRERMAADRLEQEMPHDDRQG